jgi:hypothetical protein
VHLNRVRTLALAVGVTGFALLGAACSHIQPSLGEYAITTGHGTFSNQDVIRVTSPGHRANIGSGTTSWYFPGNVRNYVTTPEGQADRSQPAPVLTRSGGAADNGMTVHVYTFVTFEVNPAIAVKGPKGNFPLATGFLTFCLKYSCATHSAQNNTANAAKERSSDPGWLNMIDEIWPRAIDNATRGAIDTFGPNIWLDQGAWPKVADEIAAQLPGEVAKLDGSSASHLPDYFCGLGSTLTKCAPIFVQVTPPGIVPVDPHVIAAYRQQQEANYQLNAVAARVKVARQLYGKDAGWFLGMFDLVSKCQSAKVPCTIYAGNAPLHP